MKAVVMVNCPRQDHLEGSVVLHPAHLSAADLMKTCFLRVEEAKLTAFDLALNSLIHSVAPPELFYEFFVLPLALQPLVHKTLSQL